MVKRRPEILIVLSIYLFLTLLLLSLPKILFPFHWLLFSIINKGQNYWALIGWERGHFFLIEGIFSNQERAWLPVNDWLIRCIILPFIDKQVIPWDLVLLRINCTWVFKIFQIALVASRLGQFWKILKTLVQLILNSTWPHVITYTNQFLLAVQNLWNSQKTLHIQSSL